MRPIQTTLMVLPALLILGCGPADPEEAIELARQLRSEGRQERAVAVLERFAAEGPGNFSLSYELALARHEARMEVEALTSVAAAIEADPDSADARHLRASILIALRRDGEAVTELRRVVARDPGRRGVHRMLGEIHTRAGRLQMSVNQFEKELSRYPDDVETMVDLGSFYLRAGEMTAAADRLERAVVTDPQSARAHRFLAELRFRQHRKEEGLEEQRLALALDPEDLDLLVNHARALYNYGYPGESGRLLEEAARGDRPDVAVLMEITRQAVDRLDFDIALETLESALEIDSQLSNAELERGKVYLRLSMEEEAMEAFQRANRLAPADPYPLFYIASILATRGETEPAIEMYRKSLDLDPLNPKAHYALGQALAHSGRREEAKEEFRLHAAILDKLRKKKHPGVSAME